MQTTTFKRYWGLIKPGIVFGNMIPVLGGFLLAEPSWKDWPTLLWVMLATFCLVGSACVFNNYYERDIDGLMTRTQNRVLVHDGIPKVQVFGIALVLFVSALVILAHINWVTFALGIFGFVVYVLIYTLLLKRHSIHQTTLGSFSGACPPVMGYCSIAGVLNIDAFLIFMLFAFWQIPHSYAIAVFRQQDYANAQIPLLPLVKGVGHTKKAMIVYWALYLATGVALYAYGTVGWVFLAIFGYYGLRWGAIGWQGFDAEDNDKWARRFFFYSIKVMMMFSLGIVVDTLVKYLIPSIYF